MAKLYFNFSAMNAGKSAILLQAAHNYRERGMRVLLMKPALDTREASSHIASRVGLSAPADVFELDADIRAHILREHHKDPIACVLIDEAQFLSEDQVWQLARIADEEGIPVMCYGLRTDFEGALFPGSKTLLAIADDLREIRTICWCGRKAIMNLRIDEAGRAVREGEQIEIGGDDRYVALCRTHFMAGQHKEK